MRIYVSHPYSGKEENKLAVEKIIKRLTEIYPHDTFISPIHTFGFMYDQIDYETGLGWCLDLLQGCDRMYVYGNWKKSRGCQTEVLFCENNFIEYKIMSE